MAIGKDHEPRRAAAEGVWLVEAFTGVDVPGSESMAWHPGVAMSLPGWPREGGH